MDKDFSSFSWFLAGMVSIMVSILIILAVMTVAVPSCYAAEGSKTNEPTMVCKDSQGLYFIAPDAQIFLIARLGTDEQCITAIDTVGKKHTFCRHIPVTDVCKPSYGAVL